MWLLFKLSYCNQINKMNQEQKRERIKTLITKTVNDITELTLEIVYSNDDENNETQDNTRDSDKPATESTY